MTFVITATFPNENTFYLNGQNQFDLVFEHAWELELDQAQTLLKDVKGRIWVLGRKRIAPPVYAITVKG